jgi:hypothetical protein
MRVRGALRVLIVAITSVISCLLFFPAAAFGEQEISPIKGLGAGYSISVSPDAKVYNSPDAEGEVLGTYREMNSVLILGTVGNWYAIRFTGKRIGYVQGADVNILQEEPSAPPEEVAEEVVEEEDAEDPEAALKRALYANPEDPLTNLRLGRLYYGRAVFSEALDFFETVTFLAPDTEYAAEAGRYIEEMTGGKKKPWSINVSAAFQYDSNVVIKAHDGPMPEGISEKSDIRTISAISGGYDLISAEKFTGSLGYSFYQSFHKDLSEFNVQAHGGRAGAIYDITDVVALKGLYTFDYTRVGGEEYGRVHELSASVRVTEAQGTSTTVEYIYGDNRFRNSENFLSNSERTGETNSGGLVQSVSLGSRISTRLGYYYSDVSTREDYRDYEGHKGFMNASLSLPLKLSVGLYGEYELRDYEEESPDYEIKREDEEYTYSLELSKGVGDSVSVSLSHTIVNNNSNVDAYEYDRSISGVMVRVRL